MAPGKKISGKKKRGFSKSSQVKKNKLAKHEIINKKALFNRYKSRQKREDELEKKKHLDRELQMKQKVTYSDTEEEDNPYEQLVSCFGGSQNSKQQAIVSESESDAEMFEQGEEHEDRDGSDSDLDTDKESQNDDNLDSNLRSKQDESDYESDKEINTIIDKEVDDEVDSPEDPFTKHLQYDLKDELVVSLSSSVPTVEQVTRTWPVLGNISITIPKPIQMPAEKIKPKVTILEEKTYASTGTIPSLISNIDFNKLHIKTQIHNNIVPANKKNLVKKDLEFTEILTPLQKELFSVMNNYQDLYYPERTFSNADEIRFTYCMHIVNHMLKTRTKILHHNAKLAKNSNLTENFQDQGLVRPKVLIMVPFKDAAYRIVKTIIDILVPKEAGQVVNKNRFEDDFTGGELLMPRKNPKPEDYELLFSGNTDDTFRLGMTLTKKTLKLYTDFYSSDVIVASPLGLRMLVGAEGEQQRDYDFLASVELLVLDQADVFLLQNWEHVLHVLAHCHLRPRQLRHTDYSRVRSWAVNGWAKYYRQTLVFAAVALPEIKSLLNKQCQNYAGKVLVSNPVELGSIRQVVLQVPQIFHRFDAANPLEAVEARFTYFLKEVLPRHCDPLMSHTLIYVPSYFDYVRIRNHFKKEDIGFVQICEYSKDAKIARARDMFFHSEAPRLLYSERAHFFRRLRVKGARHVLFYQPPTYPHFYSEMCNLMQESNQNKYGGSEFNMSVTVLFSRYDAPRLAGVLGARRAAALLAAAAATHTLVTGD